MLVMNRLGDEDKSDLADVMNRGVTIAFLVEFCRAFDLWDVSIKNTIRDYVIPMTSETRCRFVDLHIFKKYPGVVGRASTYVITSVESKFGALVAGISEGEADPNRRVCLFGFAARQWPCSKNDWSIVHLSSSSALTYPLPSCRIVQISPVSHLL
jgi:hypothetical protein